MSNTDPTKHWWFILVAPPVFGGVHAAHLGFTTSAWWSSCCSSWLHHQCLVGSDPTKHWWWNQDEQHGPQQTLVVKPRWATRTPPNTILVILPVLFFFVLCLVCLMLPVPVDCPFLSSPSLFPSVFI
jgi:hypothetical protein